MGPDDMGAEMPSPDRAWRRLLEAFSDAPTASGPSAEPVHASRARRLLEAFSDASPAFSPHFPPRSPGLEATIPGHALARGAVVFGVLGAVCTAWVAAATGTPAAAVVATLTFSILALLIAPQEEFARARTAALRTREQDARSAEPSDEHRRASGAPSTPASAVTSGTPPVRAPMGRAHRSCGRGTRPTTSSSSCRGGRRSASTGRVRSGSSRCAVRATSSASGRCSTATPGPPPSSRSTPSGPSSSRRRTSGSSSGGIRA